jgi:hypothetical protein
MGDIAVRRPATQLVVIGAAILLLLAGANIGYATLAAATSGHNGLIPAVIDAGTSNHPAVIDAGTSNHLTVTVQSHPTKAAPKPNGAKHGKGA